MTTSTLEVSNVEDVLSVWESHYGRLNFNNRQAFRVNKDAMELTQFSTHQIDRTIRLSKARYLPDILRFIKKWEYQGGAGGKRSVKPAQISQRITFDDLKKNQKIATYSCSICQAPVVGVSCLCRMVY
jgi:hypothetical protein